MSVSLVICRPGHEGEIVAICSQQTARGWFADIAREHQFQILSGEYPTIIFTTPELEQVIHEISVLRREVLKSLDEDDRMTEHDKVCNREMWDGILERVRRLRSEDGWEASFG